MSIFSRLFGAANRVNPAFCRFTNPEVLHEYDTVIKNIYFIYDSTINQTNKAQLRYAAKLMRSWNQQAHKIIKEARDKELLVIFIDNNNAIIKAIEYLEKAGRSKRSKAY